MLRVLKLKDREGTTVADNLAYSNPDLYAEEMEYFTPEERLEIINLWIKTDRRQRIEQYIHMKIHTEDQQTVFQEKYNLNCSVQET